MESRAWAIGRGAFEDSVPLYFAFSIVLSLIFVLVSRFDPGSRLRAWTHSFVAQVLGSGALVTYGFTGRPGALSFAFFFAMANTVLLLDAAETFKNTRHSRATFGLLGIAGSVSIGAFLAGDAQAGIVLTLSFRAAVLAMASWLLWRTAGVRLVGLRISSYTILVQAWFNVGCLLAFLFYSRQDAGIPLAGIAPFVFLLLDVVLALGLVLATTERTRQALAFANSELEAARAQLETLADTDPLTGCFNRRVFRTLVERRVQEGEASVGAVFLIDIDNLKVVNDTDGHPAGDALIRQVAEAVKTRVRPNELVIRWGGDEFLVVIDGVAAEEIQGRREAIGQAIEEAGLKASIGAAPFGGGLEILAAVEEADRAMYADKKRRKSSAA